MPAREREFTWPGGDGQGGLGHPVHRVEQRNRAEARVTLANRLASTAAVARLIPRSHARRSAPFTFDRVDSYNGTTVIRSTECIQLPRTLLPTRDQSPERTCWAWVLAPGDRESPT